MLNKIKKILKKRKEIRIAYLYGSVARGTSKEGSDIDIAIVLKDPKTIDKNHFFESEIALEIEKSIKKKVDARIINNATIRFVYQVLKYGKLLFASSEKDRVEFETRATEMYFDFRPFLLEYDRIRYKRLGL